MEAIFKCSTLNIFIIYFFQIKYIMYTSWSVLVLPILDSTTLKKKGGLNPLPPPPSPSKKKKNTN